MKDFFKYLTPGDEDRQWGIYINSAGMARIPPGRAPYPGEEHPSGYRFTWSKGRTLSEFQVNYITRGSGVYENEKGRFPVKEGSLLITRPEEWHRYRPSPGAGWMENYVGFDGEIPRRIFHMNNFFSVRPVLNIGNREEFIDTYQKIFDMVLEEKPGFQQVASGMIMKLLGYMVSLEKQKNFSGKRIEMIIRNACFEMREHIGQEMNFQEYAMQNNVGYSYFRKMFKQYTGVAPHQYHLDLKISRAREMLMNTNQSVKEIAYDLGFHSIHYFSRAFKKKTGIAPSMVRRTI
jgi:AraC-like DNA-binding protein